MVLSLAASSSMLMRVNIPDFDTFYDSLTERYHRLRYSQFQIYGPRLTKYVSDILYLVKIYKWDQQKSDHMAEETIYPTTMYPELTVPTKMRTCLLTKGGRRTAPSWRVVRGRRRSRAGECAGSPCGTWRRATRGSTPSGWPVQTSTCTRPVGSRYRARAQASAEVKNSVFCLFSCWFCELGVDESWFGTRGFGMRSKFWECEFHCQWVMFWFIMHLCLFHEY